MENVLVELLLSCFFMAKLYYFTRTLHFYFTYCDSLNLTPSFKFDMTK